jgi:hypothetical protein
MDSGFRRNDDDWAGDLYFGTTSDLLPGLPGGGMTGVLCAPALGAGRVMPGSATDGG